MKPLSSQNICNTEGCASPVAIFASSLSTCVFE